MKERRMALSNEMRRLETKWQTRNGWPKWLEWIEIKNIRGWTDQRIAFDFLGVLSFTPRPRSAVLAGNNVARVGAA